MKTTPMILKGNRISSLLDGRQVQIRLPVSDWQIPEKRGCDDPWLAVAQRHPRYGFCVYGETADECAIKLQKHGVSPYGKSGDLIWVRETTEVDYDTSDVVILSRYAADKKPVLYSGSDDPEYDGSIAHWNYSRSTRPSIHMKRWASRLTLKITNVRVERIQDISEEDAKAEGIERSNWPASCEPYRNYLHPKMSPGCNCSLAVTSFSTLWNSIYNNWDDNPWVWCYTFEVIKANVDNVIKEAI